MSEDELIQEAEDLKKEIVELKQKLNQEKKEEPEPQKTKRSQTEQKRKKSKEKPAQSRPRKQAEEEFDPDRLSLSKDEIIAFCDSVIEKWNEDPIKNYQQIFAMSAVRTSVLWTDEQILKDIWGEILMWGFELLFKNALAQAREGNESWAEVFDKIKKEI